MYNYMKNDNQELYAGLSKVISANGNNTKPNIFLFHFNAAVNLYKDGLLDAEKLIADYEKAIEIIGSIQPKSEIEKKLIADNVEKIESLFIGSQVASCDNLLTLFTPRFEAAPSDIALAKNIVKMLQLTDDCVDNDLYLNAVNVIYAQEPSHSSAYYLYKLYSSRGDFDNAAKYINEAVNFEESDADADAGYLYDFATFCFKNGNNAKAYEAASKAVELSDNFDGKAYWLMGSIWAVAQCGGDDIERRAKYWVATDLMIKAKNADPALAEDADRSISQYRVYYPNTADAFMYNVTNGQSYTVSCGGMRAVTTVRTNN
jgi:tetratricopeptide (TPR) repeat protein